LNLLKRNHFFKEPEIDYEQAWGFFDGDGLGTPSLCGVGAILYLNQQHYC
jgi:hypothetical protein